MLQTKTRLHLHLEGDCRRLSLLVWNQMQQLCSNQCWDFKKICMQQYRFGLSIGLWFQHLARKDWYSVIKPSKLHWPFQSFHFPPLHRPWQDNLLDDVGLGPAGGMVFGATWIFGPGILSSMVAFPELPLPVVWDAVCTLLSCFCLLKTRQCTLEFLYRLNLLNLYI